MNTERGFDLLTERVLSAVREVSGALGAGFLEKVYERARSENSAFAAYGLLPRFHLQ
jgi:hypothetical protein